MQEQSNRRGAIGASSARGDEAAVRRLPWWGWAVVVHDAMTTNFPRGALGLANLPLLIVGAMLVPSEHALAQELNRDPYFTPTAAKTTSYMPRVIIRNMREPNSRPV